MSEGEVNLEEMSAADMLAFITDMYDSVDVPQDHMFQLDFVDGNGQQRTMNMYLDEHNPEPLDQGALH